MSTDADGEDAASSGGRVTVVGSYNAGFVIDVDEIPVPGETVLGSDFVEGPGGKGSNQAIGVARLGATASFVGCVGDDHYGDEAFDLWAREGVDVEAVERVDDVATGAGFVIVDEDGENAIAVAPGANAELRAEHVENAREQIRNAHVVLCQLEIGDEAVERAVELASEAGVRTVLNPAPARELPAPILESVDYLTPNATEARLLAGHEPDADIPNETVGRELLELGVGCVVMTIGEDGALIITEDDLERVPAPVVDVVDTTGAGDAFNAGFAVALTADHDVTGATRFGCRTGAHCVTAREVIPGLPTRDDLEKIPQAEK
ncbi:ribokinase [Halobacteria archaeon AArc-curdl1]|uniref:Ribokinase n=1 Tax=Natronosalvus hydrolyticus TaxID=2979988 RepID=A0AAP2Z8Z5_9EURY|nr:ribokinase [Halobacteria archaeon AArc-curdl1]